VCIPHAVAGKSGKANLKMEATDLSETRVSADALSAALALALALALFVVAAAAVSVVLALALVADSRA
jgi:hypothetical protein